MYLINLYTAHQIRVHLQYLGHPIANDPIYAGKKVWVRYLVLISRPLSFLLYVDDIHGIHDRSSGG